MELSLNQDQDQDQDLNRNVRLGFTVSKRLSQTSQLEARNKNLGYLDISDSEIKYAITSSSPKKAPGPDGITFEILYYAYIAIPNVFNRLFKNLLKNGYHLIN